MARVTIKTNFGDIALELDEKAAPISVANFIQYATSGHYAGTIFHRVMDGFMIQGGGMDENMKQRATKPPIKNESNNGLKNDKYTVAMARTSVPDSASSQFFINTVNNDFLNRDKCSDGVGYAVFGKVVEGEEVVDKIAKVATTTKSGHQNVPVEPVKIISVSVEGQEA